jgi:hypothetical protein
VTGPLPHFDLPRFWPLPRSIRAGGGNHRKRFAP